MTWRSGQDCESANPGPRIWTTVVLRSGGLIVPKPEDVHRDLNEHMRRCSDTSAQRTR
jgi:hypothetical protein